MDKPYQLDDKIEQLFLEKSMTGASAFNRLFDETMAALTFEVDGETLPLEVTLSMLQEADPADPQQGGAGADRRPSRTISASSR